MNPGLTYTKIGDYYYPEYDPEKAPRRSIGKYGRMYQRYLHECRYELWGQLTLSGEIWERMEEIDTICNEQMAVLIPAMAKREGVTETLKAADPMAWVGRMNNIRHRAEEIVLHDYVYAD